MDTSIYTAYADYEWAIKLNRICLKMLGIWPKNNETKWEKLMTNVRVIVMLNIGFWFCTIPSVYSLLRIWGNIMSMIDNLQYTLPFTMATIKFFIMWQKKKDILPLLNMIKHDWLKPKTMQERNVMIKRARLACILTIFGYFIMLISFLLCTILPIFGFSMRYLTNKTDPGRLVPIQTYYFYDRDKSPLYEITYVLQTIGMSIFAAVYTGTDCFLSVLVFHVCGQLENLKARVIELDKFNNFENVLSYSVQDHIRLIRSINIIDNIFALMLLGALFYFGILFAFYGFLFGTVITQHRNISAPRLTFIVTTFVNTFAHTCFYCVVGEMLVAQCRKVYEAACQLKWYTLKPKKARNLLIVMICANKPLYLTAGKLFPMTMATLCNVNNC
ncbi:odorant receptor 85c-like isoform X3 [Polyergus mexicanus]|uniref:odorant receptor 85c-like isoform X3 n=1 Tax=Polyergus mexicanus TaxID=615972 RepID=UPI0038B45F9E